MFNALSGIGGGGQVDATASNNSTVALYTTFAFFAFFAGTICNRLGIKLTLSIGGFGYGVYAASFLSYDHNKNQGFVIFAGALLGFCAALLWTAQGAIMMSYPSEKMKGRFVSIFWNIFNLGAVIGSLIPLAQTVENGHGNSVGDGTYIGFMILMFLGAILAWFLVDSDKVIRKDGSKIIVMQHPTWSTELFGLWEVLKTEPWIALLFPMFMASNWFYSYQFNDVNLAKFQIRARVLNSLLYWLAQMFGSLIFGFALDSKRFSRTMRARAGWGVLFLLTMGIWGGGLAWQLGYTREETDVKGYKKIDWIDKEYGGGVVLYICYGLYDAIWQTYVYWVMGALTNNSRKLAFYAGFYKSFQSAGAAIIFRLDAMKKPYLNLFASCWGLLGGSLLVALPIILLKINDHSSIDADMAFSDENAADKEKFEQRE